MKLKIIIAWVLGGIMTALSLYPSWSQYAGTAEDPLLYATLLTIVVCFFQASKEHIHKDFIIGFGKSLGWFLGLTSLLFGGVLVFSVNNDFWWVETLHMIFTALAIMVPYYALIKYYKNGPMLYGAVMGISMANFGMIGALVFQLFPIGIGEFIAATPLSIWIYFSND